MKWDRSSAVTTNWDFDDAKSLAEANLTAAAAADKGDVFILPRMTVPLAIADAFAADTDISSYYVTGQDAEIASVQYIIDGKQSMTVLMTSACWLTMRSHCAAAVVEGKPSRPPANMTMA